MSADGHGSRLKGDTTITESVIGAAYRVVNELGGGFLEKVYENALAIELRSMGHEVKQQVPMAVRYKGEIAGLYQADLLVEGVVVVELKAVAAVDRAHRAQCLNYLRAAGLRTGLVINFGRPRLEVHRVIWNEP